MLSDTIAGAQPKVKRKRCGINPNRGYQQLGNAVSPVVVAAIGACLMHAIRDSAHHATHCRRRLVVPALTLLQRCHPRPEAKCALAPSLSEQCQAFVEGKEGSAAATTGTCPAQPPDLAEQEEVRRLLTHQDRLAQAMGLHAVKDTAHRQLTLTKRVPSALTALLLLVVPLLHSVDEEVSRLSVVTLCIMSRDQRVALELSALPSVGHHLRALSSARYHALAEQALKNILEASEETEDGS